MKNPPIFIIGAGRSGTNMLRDCLCKLHKVETWPCDEINYIWRHGNLRHPSDRFTADDVNDKARKYIPRQFDRIESMLVAEHIVEKTCANSLRVPFIEELFPQGKYVCIVRDGFDVASSAAKRWVAPLDIPYIMAKARFVPKSDLIFYASRYAWNRLKKVFSKEKRLAFWGPMYPGIQEDLQKYDAVEVSARQWSICVDTSLNDLAEIDSQRVHFVKYEAFVNKPFDELKKIVSFLGLQGFSDDDVKKAVASVTQKSVGKSKSNLSEDILGRIEKVIQPTQERIDKHNFQ